ncbi:unnamed protein product, partial [Rotaria sordida]
MFYFHVFNINKISEKYHKKLEEWHLDCYKKIDYLFEQKCQELNQRLIEKIKEQEEEILNIQTKLKEIFDDQETTRKDIDTLTSDIRHLGRMINHIEEKCFDLNTSPLLIDEDLIDIQELDEYKLDLSIFTPIYKTIDCISRDGHPISSNNRFLLIYQNPNLCLYDRQMSIVKQTTWSYGHIWNMCWSSKLNRFIIVEENTIYLLNENTMLIENVKTIEAKKWLSCTCSDEFLFLSTRQWGSSIDKFRLLTSITFDRYRISSKTYSNDEYINDIVDINNKLILIITNKTKKSVRLELRSSNTLDQLWLLQLDITLNQDMIFYACSLDCDEWLITDYETRRLLHVTDNGQIKTIIEYNEIPYSICRFGFNLLAVS